MKFGNNATTSFSTLNRRARRPIVPSSYVTIGFTGVIMGMGDPIKPVKRPRIGLYSIGHAHYWEQFEGLLERLLGYGRFIESRLGQWGEVHYAGMVDGEAKARCAAEKFNAANVDLILCHAATYAMSASHIHIAQHCRRPVVVLNLQPTSAMDYQRTTTGEWLANCVGCCVPEIANAFHRGGIEFRVVSGLLGLDHTPEVSLADEVTADHPEAIAAWEQIRTVDQSRRRRPHAA